jgi:hypothetical protein
MFTTGGSGFCTCCIVKAYQSSASIDGTHLKKGLHVSDFLEIANFLSFTGWIGRFKRKHNIACSASHESRSVDSETVGD